MKNNIVAATLLGMLLVSTFVTAVFTYRYVSIDRKLRGLQVTVDQINNNRNIMQALANDTLEYSKKNPSIDPILQSIGLKRSTNAPAPAPAKPATK